MTNDPLSLPDLGWSNFFQQQMTLEEAETHAPLRVMQAHRNAVEALGVGGPARIAISGAMADAGVSVGDWVLVDAHGSPARLLERKSVLQRRASGDAPSAQMIAANVDTLFIVSSCNADFNLARLERYLVLARQGDIEPVLVLTKADLCDDPDGFRSRAERDLPGVAVETVVATDPEVAAQLAPWCGRGQTVALLGSSGVGKSTLINALSGAATPTQAIREDDAKGRHTTTRRSMFATPGGAWVIDTPGMRALRLADVAEGVAAVFADVAELARGCKFRDCAHESEPGCAVQAAIAAGDLDAGRLKRWLKLLREDARHTQTLAENRARTRELGKKYAGGRARMKAKRGDFQ